MSIELLEDKIERTIETLLNKFRKTSCCKIREFAAFVGILVFQCPALKYGVIHVRHFERAHALEENNNNYNALVMTFSKDLDKDVAWWKTNICSARTSINDRCTN